MKLYDKLKATFYPLGRARTRVLLKVLLMSTFFALTVTVIEEILVTAAIPATIPSFIADIKSSGIDELNADIIIRKLRACKIKKLCKNRDYTF